ncbi:MAG: hypothetical protein GEU98_20615 [Pseudonocardiaceae bacterium]|nr:hypothetical protein [Pseudonocardiaceae bacterium]
MLTRISVLAGLAEELRRNEYPLAERWSLVHEWFERRVALPGFRARLREYLRALPADRAGAVANRSRETTTHFAWCLLDEPDDPFSFWLNEYKPQRDWQRGYADSVHNHRYHFCTTILSGSYLHERFDVRLDSETGLIASARLRRRTVAEEGSAGMLLASDFHRIPRAVDNTMTFLVKSRPVYDSSLSYDPVTGTGRRHVPVESRLGELTERI